MGDVSGSGGQHGGGRPHTQAGAGHLPCTIPRTLTPSHPGQGRLLRPPSTGEPRRLLPNHTAEEEAEPGLTLLHQTDRAPLHHCREERGLGSSQSTQQLLLHPAMRWPSSCPHNPTPLQPACKVRLDPPPRPPPPPSIPATISSGSGPASPVLPVSTPPPPPHVRPPALLCCAPPDCLRLHPPSPWSIQPGRTPICVKGRESCGGHTCLSPCL